MIGWSWPLPPTVLDGAVPKKTPVGGGGTLGLVQWSSDPVRPRRPKGEPMHFVFVLVGVGSLVLLSFDSDPPEARLVRDSKEA